MNARPEVRHAESLARPILLVEDNPMDIDLALQAFVVLTTSRESSDISRAYELGVNSYIVKPVNFAAFAEVVQHIKAYWLLINEPPFAGPARRQP